MKWGALVDAHAIGALLGDDYQHFARPIGEALAVFLAGLPAAAQRSVLASQAALPAPATVSQRLGALAQQCPVLHKLGQTLARDRRLHPELRRELRKLETLPSTLPARTLRSMLERELGPLEDLGVRLDSTAVAQASVAVVIGYQDAQRRGVFKVLKRDVEARMEHELELLTRVGLYLDDRCAQLGIPKLGYEEAFQRIKEKLRDEVRLDVEQGNLLRAAKEYADLASVQVPTLHPYCTRRVTAMERVTGRKITDHGLGCTRERNELASVIATSLLTHPIFSTREQAIFHGDPHAGNLLLTPEGRLAILDWSLAGVLKKKDREALVHILIGAMMLDEAGIVKMLEAFAEGAAPDRAKLFSVVRKRLRSIPLAGPPPVDWLVGLVDDAVERARLRATADLLLFRKSLHTLGGVVAEIGVRERLVDQALSFAFLRHLSIEWPQRWLAAPDSREFATHLSNADLTRLVLSYPSVLGRFWLRPASETTLNIEAGGS